MRHLDVIPAVDEQLAKQLDRVDIVIYDKKIAWHALPCYHQPRRTAARIRTVQHTETSRVRSDVIVRIGHTVRLRARARPATP
jgi:hypothetical protein